MASFHTIGNHNHFLTPNQPATMASKSAGSGPGSDATPHTAASATHHLSSNNRVLGRAPLKAERSCIVCHRRKVRCDKKSPCSGCTRAGVLCCYPAKDKAKTRRRKTTMAEIASRLVQLERTIVAVSNERPSPDPAPGGAPLPESSESPGDESNELVLSEVHRPGTPSRDGGMLVQNGYSSHYINETLLCRVLEEARLE